MESRAKPKYVNDDDEELEIFTENGSQVHAKVVAAQDMTAKIPIQKKSPLSLIDAMAAAVDIIENNVGDAGFETPASEYQPKPVIAPLTNLVQDEGKQRFDTTYINNQVLAAHIVICLFYQM